MIGPMRRFACLLVVFSIACGGTPAELPDVSLIDGGHDMDVSDLGSLDAFTEQDLGTSDFGPDDLGPEDLGVDGGMASAFGTIAGPCAQLDTELTDAAPSYFVNRLDFMSDGFDDPEERPLLTPGAQRILEEGTAGGSSGVSEAFAYEVLARCEGAELVKTETEIRYDVSGSITDMSVMLGTERIGVSVARAFYFPPTDPYPLSEADRVLRNKLEGILESSANVREADAWTKQILAIVAYGDMHAEQMMTAWEAIEESLRADTIIYVIITDGDDEALY
ncbi:MAG: hypothetical protein CMN30_30015 [Sandaracinus sp.]|nr:hypothetical protein [Sandaracinus sp.]|tara:strand:+ start:337 stop:1170 length:834 start_codon:yes stop_codon:yes gene_type:complete